MLIGQCGQGGGRSCSKFSIENGKKILKEKGCECKWKSGRLGAAGRASITEKKKIARFSTSN